MPVKTMQVVRSEGIPYYQLIAFIRNGRMPPPAKDASGDYLWEKKDIEAARRAAGIDRRKRETAGA